MKRGGTVNLVTHAIDVECAAENIPQFIEADVGALEINHSLHLSDVELPPGVKPLAREDVTLVTIVPPSGYAEELKAAAAAAAGTAAPAAGAAPALLLQARPPVARRRPQVAERRRPQVAATKRSKRPVERFDIRDAACRGFATRMSYG